MPEVLVNETEALFGWQFKDGACPAECVKEDGGNGWCVKKHDEGKKGHVRNEL